MTNQLTASPDVETAQAASRYTPTSAQAALAVGRILLGFVFLWAFLDKTFGLGFATPSERSWISGTSPAAGYLSSVDGSLAGFFASLAGEVWVDWAFMLGMLLVGAALVLGVALRIAAIGATLLMGSLWLSSLPLAHNPVVDEHIVYIAMAWVLAATHAGDFLGLGRLWRLSSPTWLR